MSREILASQRPAWMSGGEAVRTLSHVAFGAGAGWVVGTLASLATLSSGNGLGIGGAIFFGVYGLLISRID